MIGLTEIVRLLDLPSTDVSQFKLPELDKDGWTIVGAIAAGVLYGSYTAYIRLDKNQHFSVLDGNRVGMEGRVLKESDLGDEDRSKIAIRFNGSENVVVALRGLAGYREQATLMDPSALVRGIALARTKLRATEHMPPPISEQQRDILAADSDLSPSEFRLLAVLVAGLPLQLAG